MVEMPHEKPFCVQEFWDPLCFWVTEWLRKFVMEEEHGKLSALAAQCLEQVSDAYFIIEEFYRKKGK